MKDIEPLRALLEQTERERDAVQAELGRAMKARQAALDQFEALQRYRLEYEDRWGAQFRQQATMDVMHCYQGFNVRLGQAIEQQQRTVELASQRVQREQVRLSEHEVRVASVGQLIERRIQAWVQRQERQEQKQMDAFAARVGWARLAAAARREREAALAS